MRAVAMGVVVLAAVGCGRKPAEETGTATPTAPRPTPAVPAKRGDPEEPPPAKKAAERVGPVRWADVYKDYNANELEADLKYKGKRVAVDVDRITAIGRNSAGLPYLGTDNWPTLRVEPNAVFVFADDQAAAIAPLRVRQKDVVRVEGVCEGKTPDGIRRTPYAGFEWHVKFRDCRLAP